MSAANARVTDQYDMEIRSNSTANLHKQPQSPVGPESIHVQVNDGVSPFNYNGSMDHVMSQVNSDEQVIVTPVPTTKYHTKTQDFSGKTF